MRQALADHHGKQGAQPDDVLRGENLIRRDKKQDRNGKKRHGCAGGPSAGAQPVQRPAHCEDEHGNGGNSAPRHCGIYARPGNFKALGRRVAQVPPPRSAMCLQQQERRRDGLQLETAHALIIQR